MSLHPEDLYRMHQLLHAEMIKNNALERQARAARRPRNRLRENGFHILLFVRSRSWWKRLTTLITRRSHRAGTGTTPLPAGAPTIVAPAPAPVGSPASVFTDPVPTTTR